MSLSELTEIALNFPADQQAELAKALCENLDETLDPRLEELWRLELAERIRQTEAGEIEPVPAEDARRQAQDKIDEARRLSSTRK